jgi:hypothetical protein
MDTTEGSSHMATESKCPFHQAAGGGTTNRDWWPNQLNLKILHQHSSLSDPMDEGFNYAEAFKSLDFAAVKRDLTRIDDRLAGLVARRLRSLWPALRPHGLALRARIAPATAVVAPAPASNASLRSTAGRTTSASTRHAGCSGRSSKNMVATFPGPT